MKTIAYLMLLLITSSAMAGGNPHKKPPPANQTINSYNQRTVDSSVDQTQTQTQNQAVDQSVSVAAGDTTVNTGDTAIDAGDTSFSSNTENNSSNLVLVPNNNTENCLRVFGFGFSNDGASGGIGIPWRSQQCDLEAAADDAFAQGNHELGWMLKCKQKSMRKAFGGEAECLEVALGQVRMADRIEQLKHQRDAVIAECEHQKAVRDEANERCTRRYQEAMSK